MYANIICAIDGSDLSTKALRHALAFAAKADGKVTAVTVTEPSIIVAPGAEIMMVDTSSIIEDLETAKAESAKKILADADAVAAEAGTSIAGMHIANSPAAEGILHAGKEIGADLVVMGSHGRRGLGRLLLGSQTAEVLAHADIPVLVIK